MPTPAQRFQGWIESLTTAWGDRLRGWMSSWVMRGVESFLEDIEPDSIAQTRDLIEKIRANPATPPMVKAWLDHYEAGGFNPLIIIGIVMVVAQLIQIVQTIWIPASKQMSYAEEKTAQTFRLDPFSVITAWRRDPVTHEKWFDDLKDQGWSDERIEALKFFTQAFPSLRDVVGFYAHEVFEPDMIERYGLKDELPPYAGTLFEKLGVSKEVADQYWMDHWQHASWVQVLEMLYRGLITEEDVYEWFRVVEIPPFWRDKLIQSAYTWPTRVDVRRWWDMRTIDEARLRELYSGMGYRGKNLDDYVLWTKVYVAFPDLLARWQNGWITEQDVRNELVKLGMPDARVNEMIQAKKKSVDAAKVEEGKALTKTEIYKGLKEGKISRSEAVELLMDLNYSLTQASYLLDINVEALSGSPETYEAFKKLTTEYKIATGKEEKPMPEELIKAGEEVVRLTEEVKSLQQALTDQLKEVVDEEALPAQARAKINKTRVALHRAEAELERVKGDYKGKIAQWRREA